MKLIRGNRDSLTDAELEEKVSKAKAAVLTVEKMSTRV